MTKVLKKCVYMIIAVAMLSWVLICFAGCKTKDSRLGKYVMKDSNGNVISYIDAKAEHSCDVQDLYYNGSTKVQRAGTFTDCYFNCDNNNVVTLKIGDVGYFGQLDGNTVHMSSQYGVKPSSDYIK